MSKIKAVILDVGGVLVDYDHDFAFNTMAKSFGVTFEEIEKIFGRLGHKLLTGELGSEQFRQLVIAETGAKNVPENEELWSHGFGHLWEPLPESSALVEEVKQAGYRVAVLSDTIDEHVRVIRKNGVYDPFELCILSNEVGLAKPDPKIFQLTLDRLGLQPEETVFIDDRRVNVEAAEKMGINAIKFENIGQVRQDLEQLGVL